MLSIFVSQSIAEEIPNLTRLGIEKGLSNNYVRSILQDQQGFIWMGTYDGLNRYNGSQFKIFRNRLGDTSSLPHNYIYALHQGPDGELWVGTGQGAATLDHTNGKFSRIYYVAYLTGQIQLEDHSVHSFYTDEKKNVLIGTNGAGLMQRKHDEKLASQIPLQKGNDLSTNYDVKAILKAGNSVFVFVNMYGLCVWDQKNNLVVPVNLSVKSANCMISDEEGHIWIGSDIGVDKFHIRSNQYKLSLRNKPGQLNAPLVSSLFIDAENSLWIGTDGGGINILRNNGNISYLVPGSKKNSLSSESVYTIYRDQESRIWIGTLKGGCNVIDPFKNRFQTISVDQGSNNSLPSNFIHSFCEDRQTGEILIGTDGGGLSIWNRSRNSFRNFKSGFRENTLSYNIITSIVQGSNGIVWLASFGGGVNRFNKAEGSFKRYACINDSTGIDDKFSYLLFEDHTGTLWATTFGNGNLYRYNPQKDKFEVFSQTLDDIIAIAEDRTGQLWGGNSGNLIKIDRSGTKHQYYTIGKPVRAILEDKDGHLWIGSEGGGLNLFDIKTGKVVERYSELNGLSNNSVLNIRQDREGYLWLSTFNGLSRFDPVSKSFENFFQNDGLQSNQFTFNAAAVLSTGELMFGGINGFNVFDPAAISTRNYMPPLLITDLVINNKRLSDDDRFIRAKNNTSILELEIPYSEALMSFRVDALEYSAPDKIAYAYLLEGWDRNWNYAGNNHSFNYNNLREGAYLLRVKSTNARGVWNNKETVLKIIVLPPWYRSFWAYLVYLAVIGGILYVFNRYRVNQVRLEYQVELARTNAETEKEKNEKRLSFFTNISHEIRTPLTLIINPIKDLIGQQGEKDHTEMSSIYSNAKRLLGLVDQLLLFRKTETDTGQFTVGKLNLAEISHEITAFFVQLAKVKHIQLSIDVSDKNLTELYGDKGKIEMIVYNLVSNALKYTPDHGKVNIWIEENETAQSLFVADTGPGIPANVGDKLFDKFYQVHDKGRTSQQGFGIGMYLAKQLTDLHKGELSYQSNPGEGTVFQLRLLKGKAHFNEGIEIIEEAVPLAPIIHEIAEAQQLSLEPATIESDGLESLIEEKHSILIVDDNAQMRSYLVREFHKDYIVYEAADGEEAMKMTREKMPDIIISDVVMSNKSGLDFCQEVKATPQLSHIPLILISGSYSPETKKKGIELGADDYITKPFEKDLLLARVQNLIRNTQNLQKYFYNEITHQQNTLKISAEYKEFLDTCIDIVEKHLDDDDFNVLVLASKIGMSHSKLYKLIKSISGQSANAFIRYIRLRKAAEMFITTDYNVNQAAFFVGIKDVKYFREQFTKTFGMKPSDYIKKYRKNFGRVYKVNDGLSKD